MIRQEGAGGFFIPSGQHTMDAIRALWRRYQRHKDMAISEAELPPCFALPQGVPLREDDWRIWRRSLSVFIAPGGEGTFGERSLRELAGAEYGCERYGITFADAPAVADWLLITGPISRDSVPAIRATYEAMSSPKLVIAIGDSAMDGGCLHGTTAVVSDLASVVPVAYVIPGEWPDAGCILAALLALRNQSGAGVTSAAGNINIP